MFLKKIVPQDYIQFKFKSELSCMKLKHDYDETRMGWDTYIRTVCRIRDGTIKYYIIYRVKINIFETFKDRNDLQRMVRYQRVD